MRARWLISLLMFALAFPALAQDRRGGSLDRVLPHVRQSVPGTFYDAEGPFFGSDGQATYRLKWMTPDGRIIWLNVDAQNGHVLGGAPSGSRSRSRDDGDRGGWGPRNNWQDNGRGGWGDRDGRGGRDNPWGGPWGDRNNQGNDQWGNRGGPSGRGGWEDRSGGRSGGWGNRNQGGDRGGDRGGRSGWGGRDQGGRDQGGRGDQGGWGGRGGRGNDDRGGGPRHRPGG